MEKTGNINNGKSSYIIDIFRKQWELKNRQLNYLKKKKNQRG